MKQRYLLISALLLLLIFSGCAMFGNVAEYLECTPADAAGIVSILAKECPNADISIREESYLCPNIFELNDALLYTQFKGPWAPPPPNTNPLKPIDENQAGTMSLYDYYQIGSDGRDALAIMVVAGVIDHFFERIQATCSHPWAFGIAYYEDTTINFAVMKDGTVEFYDPARLNNIAIDGEKVTALKL